jgi:molybdopterin/thiamine biosynthesis adenylyltransferase
MPNVNIGIVGAGAVGSKVAEYLAAPGVTFYIFDDDKVEEKNIACSAYNMRHVNKRKVNALAEIVVQRGADAVPVHGTIESGDDITKHDLDIVIDGFDTPECRSLTVGLNKQDGNPIPTIHVGVGQQGNGQCMWDRDYKLPPPSPFKRGDNPVCTSALGKRLIFRTATRAGEIIEEFYSNPDAQSDIVAEIGDIG